MCCIPPTPSLSHPSHPSHFHTLHPSHSHHAGLLDLATSYCEERLKEKCEEVIKHSVTVDNAAMLYEVATKYKAEVGDLHM